MIDQRDRNDQRTDNGSDRRGPVDDTLGHLVVFAHLVIVGIAAALFFFFLILVIIGVQIVI